MEWVGVVGVVGVDGVVVSALGAGDTDAIVVSENHSWRVPVPSVFCFRGFAHRPKARAVRFMCV